MLVHICNFKIGFAHYRDRTEKQTDLPAVVYFFGPRFSGQKFMVSTIDLILGIVATITISFIWVKAFKAFHFSIFKNGLHSQFARILLRNQIVDLQSNQKLHRWSQIKITQKSGIFSCIFFCLKIPDWDQQQLISFASKHQVSHDLRLSIPGHTTATHVYI